ncbi:hypothetical protein ACSMX9_22515 [Streptomyces sp. LE64]|uniref:hypothetical protein n=1 Tax=Streptomyces sp. LE64 TaxID=3448653 RepID=UPI0040439367
MTPPPHDDAPESVVVAVALAEIRGAIGEGFARVDGSLALVVQRHDQTDRALTDVEERVTALERARWPLPSIAALVGAVGLILTVWQMATRP